MKNHTTMLNRCSGLFACSIAALYLMAIASASAATGPGGEGALNGRQCFDTKSKTITRVCAKYKIGWKLWGLMGEPVGDYRLKWELESLSFQDGFYSWGVASLPPELVQPAQRIELFLDVAAHVFVDSRQALARHDFNTGVAVRAGETSFNTPESPNWDKTFLRISSRFSDQTYLGASEARKLFASSSQPDRPIRLANEMLGPKSAVSSLDALEGKITELCGNPATAEKFGFCPPLKEKTEKKQEAKKEAKKDAIEDAFSKMEQAKTGKTSTSRTAANDSRSVLDKGKTASAGQRIDSMFASVAAHRKDEEIKRQRKAEELAKNVTPTEGKKAEENERGVHTIEFKDFYVSFNKYFQHNHLTVEGKIPSGKVGDTYTVRSITPGLAINYPYGHKKYFKEGHFKDTQETITLTEDRRIQSPEFAIMNSNDYRNNEIYPFEFEVCIAHTCSRVVYQVRVCGDKVCGEARP